MNDGITKIESYIKCLKRETVERAQLIDSLEVATSYYDEQNGEVKTVAQVLKILNFHFFKCFNCNGRFRHILTTVNELNF